MLSHFGKSQYDLARAARNIQNDVVGRNFRGFYESAD
jgi:hypothetical protein